MTESSSNLIRDHLLVGLHHGLVEVGAAEVASVDEEILVAEGLAGGVGPAHEAADAHHRGLCAQVHDVPDDVAAQQVQDAEFQRLGLLEHEQVAPVVGEGEGDVGARDGHAREFFDDVLELDVVALEKLAPRGGVVEEVAHREIGSRRGGDGGRFRLAEGARAHFRGGLVLRPPRAERHFRHGRDAGERLPAEAVGEDLLQVLGRGDLGGGVALEAEHGVHRAHAAAVVDDLDERAPGVGHDDGDLARARVHGVLHQLLHHGRRPLHDLARGDHVGNLRRQDLQLAHPPTAGSRISRCTTGPRR